MFANTTARFLKSASVGLAVISTVGNVITYNRSYQLLKMTLFP